MNKPEIVSIQIIANVDHETQFYADNLSGCYLVAGDFRELGEIFLNADEIKLSLEKLEKNLGIKP